MKFNISFIAGACFVAFYTGLALAKVGDNYEAATYSWWLPFEVLAVLSTSFILGFFGKKDK